MYKRIPGLDGLRALSIALVLIAHASGTFHSLPNWLAITVLFIGNGSLGVTIFFIISGFLITTLLLTELETSGEISVIDFYIRRAFRIWPAFYAMVGCVAILGAMHAIPLTRGEVISASLFVWNYYPHGATWFLGHTWSLAVEEQFYLVWPVLLLVLKPRRAVWLAVVIVIAEPLIRILTYGLVPSMRPHIPIMGHTRADALMIGTLAGLLNKVARFKEVLRPLFAWRIPLVGAIFVFMVDPLLQKLWRGAYLLTVGYTVQNLFIALVLLWIIHHPISAVGRVLNAKWITHFGVLSYSLYLWQQLFLFHGSSIPFPLTVLCVIAAAEVSYWTIERPFLCLRKKISRQVEQIFKPSPILNQRGCPPLAAESAAIR